MWTERTSSEWSEGVIELVLGAAIMAGSAIVDVIMVAPDVQRHNDEIVRVHPFSACARCRAAPRRRWR